MVRARSTACTNGSPSITCTGKPSRTSMPSQNAIWLPLRTTRVPEEVATTKETEPPFAEREGVGIRLCSAQRANETHWSAGFTAREAGAGYGAKALEPAGPGVGA